MTQSQAWLKQAESDVASVKLFLDAAKPETYCQAIAKCQQTVEKSVKAIVAALNEVGELGVKIGYKHDAERFMSALLRGYAQKKQSSKDVCASLVALLSPDMQSGIRALDALVPKAPPPGQLPARNTEYPFQDVGGSWKAPAQEGVFTLAEMQRFRSVAERLHVGSAKILSAIKRAYIDPA